MKRSIAVLTALCLMILPVLAMAEGMEELILSATVQPNRELALKAPASGELAPFTLKAGDIALAGDTLFMVEPVRVYAEIDGTVAAIYAAAGESADAAVTRYGAVMQLEYAQRYALECENLASSNRVENRDLFVGTTVYLRSANENHHAEGVITAVEGARFTVAVRGGDLVFTEGVRVYREPNYRNTSLLARASLTSIPPYAVQAKGTVVDVAVNSGDAVKPGDYLFSYVPDVLEPALRAKKAPTSVEAEVDSIVLSVAANQGASVQKGQLLATVCPVGEYRLEAQVEEGDLHELSVGQSLTVRFEEANAPDAVATVTSIGAVGSSGDVSRYPVYLSFEADAAVLPGMHATVTLER